MSRFAVAIITFVILYNAIGLTIWSRAARHYRPGLPWWTRYGFGFGFLRSGSYTEEGQPYRRALLWLYAVGIPVMLLWLWAWGVL